MTKKLIDKLGGTTAVANIFGISPAAVSKWKKQGIPTGRMMYLELKYPKIVKDHKNDEKCTKQ